MSSEIPTPRSYYQILGEILDTVSSRVGVSNLRVGSALLSVLEAAAQSDARNSQDIFQLLNSVNLDTAEGVALERLGAEEGLRRIPKSPAYGFVTVSDSSFTKIASTVFYGRPAPIVGATTLYVDDATEFTGGGSVYIGRNTSQYEGPLVYTSCVDVGGYWALTLATPTTKFHNHGESVVLSQGGNRTVPAGSVVATSVSNEVTAVTFSVRDAAVLVDGETETSGVMVVAVQPGVTGNVAAGGITAFSGTPPFAGASVSNPTPFTNGTDIESYDAYRQRIKSVRNSRQKGTALALETSVLGAVSSDDSRRVVSASCVSREGYPTTLHIDDGSGYEETSSGVGVETLVASASGGEQFFQTTQRPISKAFVESTVESPYDISDSSQLVVDIGGVEYIHSFFDSDFRDPAAATAYEIVASINANPDLGFTARTSNNGGRVVLTARDTENEFLTVMSPDTGYDANIALQFPAPTRYTAMVYRNDRMLYKDGIEASVLGRYFGDWSAFSGNQTLIIAVDGTSAATYTFTAQTFIDAGTGYSAVGRNSLEAWVGAINATVPGITASVYSGKIKLVSNLGASNRAAIVISGGTLVSNLVFDATSAQGYARDYTVDVNTGQIRLETPLSAGDKLSIGTFQTRAFVESAEVTNTDVLGDAYFWLTLDGDVESVTHGINATVPLSMGGIGATNHYISSRIYASGTVFSNVAARDQMVLWDSRFTSDQSGVWRISQKDSDSQIRVQVPAMNFSRAGSAAGWVRKTGEPSLPVVCGGFTAPSESVAYTTTPVPGAATASTEYWDPVSRKWVLTGTMATPRVWHTCTPYGSGRYLLAIGGMNQHGETVSAVESYDALTGVWTAKWGYPSGGIYHHQAVWYNDGGWGPCVFICGGHPGTGTAPSNVWWIYRIATNSYVASGTMATARCGHRAILMSNGHILIAGGYVTYDESTRTGTKTDVAEIFNTTTHACSSAGTMAAVRADFGMENLDAVVLVVGGDGVSAGTYEYYSWGTGLWYGTYAMPTVTGGVLLNPGNEAVNVDGTVYVPYCAPASVVTYPVSNIRTVSFSGSPPVATALNPSSFWGARKFAHAVSLLDSTGSESGELFTYGGVSLAPNACEPVATHEQYTVDSATWSTPCLLQASGIILSESGTTVLRTENNVKQYTIPSGLGYSAFTLRDTLNSVLEGASASVYQTDRVRVCTNSMESGRSTGWVGSNPYGATLGFGFNNFYTNTVPHFGYVESGSTEIGTPSRFRLRRVCGADNASVSSASNTLVLASGTTDDAAIDFSGGENVVMLPHPDQRDPNYANFVTGIGNDLPFRTQPMLVQPSTSSSIYRAVDINTRESPVRGWVPGHYVTGTYPYVFAPEDSLMLTLDSESDPIRYTIPMSRTLKPTSGTYAATNAYTDTDNSGASLAATFGLGYSFDDFAVYMAARAKTHHLDSTKTVLWRWWRLGPEGNHAGVRYELPDAPDAAIDVRVTSDYSDIQNSAYATVTPRINTEIVLAGGSARENSVTNRTTRIGVVQSSYINYIGKVWYLLGYSVYSATRTTGTNTIVLTMPGSVGEIQNPGLQIGDRVWFQSATEDPAKWSSMVVTVSSLVGYSAGKYTFTSTTVMGTDANVTTTLSPGTVSYDTSGEAYFDLGIQTGDYFRVGDGSTLADEWKGYTIAVAGAARQYLYGSRRYATSGTGTSTTVTLGYVNDTENLMLFQSANNTVTEIVAAVNAISYSPVSGTVVGDGTGTVVTPTFVDNSDGRTLTMLTDGVNYVRATTSPALITDNYQLTFKQPITAGLASSSDWANERIAIVPTTAKSVVRWLNTLGVTGLSSRAEVAASNNGRAVQITSLTPGGDGSVQINGGAANLATATVIGNSRYLSCTLDNPARMPYHAHVLSVASDDVVSMVGDRWLQIDNGEVRAKAIGFTGSTTLTNNAFSGSEMTWTLSSPIYTEVMSPRDARVTFIRVGKFTAIVFPPSMNLSATYTGWSGLQEKQWIRITTPTSVLGLAAVSAANMGVYEIVRVDTDYTVSGPTFPYSHTIWIENTESVEQSTEIRFGVYTHDSMMPGDKFVVNTDKFGSLNAGEWVVTNVGEDFTYRFTFATAYADRDVGSFPAYPIAFGADYPLITVVEKSPGKVYRKVLGATPNATDSRYVDLWCYPPDGFAYGAVNESAGSVITVLDKLGFDTYSHSGIYGYRYGTGLVGECSKIVYGSDADPVTYPGVVAAGARVDISGPVVRRVSVSVSVRTTVGVATAEISRNIRTSIASVVNQTPVGEAVALSDIIAAVSGVSGVVSVVMLYPVMTTGSDLIQVQPFEKAMVIDADRDVTVTFLGE